MTRARPVLALLAAVACASLLGAQAAGKKAAAKRSTSAPAFDESLPPLGAQLAELPAGPGKLLADAACLKCHSADILRQQRLNEKQWATNLTKMVGWGAEVPDDKREELLVYLVKNFGPDNDLFKPVVTRPAGR